MRRRWGLGLALTLAACRSTPAPEPSPWVGEGRDVSRVVLTQPVVIDAGEVARIESITLEGGADFLVVKGTLTIQNARLELQGRAIQLEAGGTLVLEDTEVACDRQGLLMSGGEATIRRTTFEGCADVGVIVSGGAATLETVTVRGGEYGVQVRGEGEITTDGLAISDVVFAGVGLSGVASHLGGLSVTGAARHGALIVTDPPAPVVVEGLYARGVRGMTVQVLRGTVTLSDLDFAELAPELDGTPPVGLYVEDSNTTVNRATIDASDGTALFVRRGQARAEGGTLSGTGPYRAAVDGEALLTLVAFGALSGGIDINCVDGGLVVLEGTTLQGATPACVQTR